MRLFVVQASSCVLILGCLVTESAAAGGTAKYDIKHTFNLQINPAIGQVYRGVWAWYARDKAVGIDGTDNGTPPNETGVITFTPPNGMTKSCTAVRNNAKADSDTKFSAAANGTGFHQITGKATVVDPPGVYARASSGSMLSLNIGTQDRQGNVKWQPVWHSDTIDQAKSAGKDPLTITILDFDTGLTQESVVWDTGFELNSPGQTQWENGHMHMDADSGSFYLFMESPFLTSAQGHINLAFNNGIVTTSDDAGVFDGILPSVGASSHGMDLAIGDANGNIDLSYNFGGGNNSGFDSGFGFGTDGAAEATPEPATWIAIGIGTLAMARRRAKK